MPYRRTPDAFIMRGRGRIIVILTVQIVAEVLQTSASATHHVEASFLQIELISVWQGICFCRICETTRSERFHSSGRCHRVRFHVPSSTHRDR